MDNNGRALIYLGSHNQIDQISPIIYKLGERRNIGVDVVLESRVSPDDYRIQAIDMFENVIICNKGKSNSQLSAANQAFELVKQIGRRMPTDIPRKLYDRFTQTTQTSRLRLSIPDQFSDNEYDVIAFHWGHAMGEETTHFANDDDLITIVLPHGDSPFINNIENQTGFNKFIQEESYFTRRAVQSEIGYQDYDEFLKHDYIVFPNNLTADRIGKKASKGQIKIFGSPRYNSEWLSILSEIRTRNPIRVEAKTNVVFFLRRGGYFISKNEVKNTLRLLNKFDDVSTIVKEHPRKRLLSQSVSDNMENITIVKDEISSASVIEWGDIFLSVGSTITFEPIMKQKPVLSLEYTHANHTVVSDYFSDAEIRSKDDLYHTLFDLLIGGTDNYYDESAHQKFVNEMISPNKSPVLDTWAKFIESKCI
jgi:hypothetical protein